VADLLQIIRARALRFLERQGVIDVAQEATVVPGNCASLCIMLFDIVCLP
jgi:hypothetical protein